MSTEILIQEPDVVQVTVNESNVVVTPGYSSINVSINESDPTVVTISNDQGPQGVKGNTGDTGAASTVAGPAGVGVPAGGTTNQVLSKIDGTSYNTQWSTPSATGVTSISATAPLSTGGSAITSTGTITIADATTSVKGAVQLSDSVSAADSTKAATSAAVKSANDNANNKVASIANAPSDTTITIAGTSTNPTVKVNSISNTQVSGLGTASTKDIPVSGDASTSQVVYGTDTRLTNSRTPSGAATGGDLAGTYPSPTLVALSPSPAGTYGSASVVPAITVDAKGRTTSVTSTNIAIASSAVSGLATSATTDTTNADNITSGTLPNARLVSVPDSALATISTTGKVSNSATTATDANTASAIVARDGSGNFSAGIVTSTGVQATTYKSSGGTGNYLQPQGGQSGASLAVISSTTVSYPIFVNRSTTNQSADAMQYSTSGNTISGGVTVNGQLYSGSTSAIRSQVGGAIISSSGNGTTATLVTTTAPNLSVGDIITVTGMNPSTYNTSGIVPSVGAYVTAVSNSSPFSVSYTSAGTGTYVSGGSINAPAQVSVTTRNAGTKGLVVKGASSQVANLLELQNSSSTTLLNVDPAGNIGITDSTTAPTVDPSGGGVLYSVSGSPRWRGSSTGGAGVIQPKFTAVVTSLKTHTATAQLEAVFAGAPGTTNGAITLKNDTWYEFRGQLIVNRAAVVAPNSGVMIGATFSQTPQTYALAGNGFNPASAAANAGSATASGDSFLVTNAATSSTTGLLVNFQGVIKTNATTGGTFTLQFAQGSAANTYNTGQCAVQAGSFIKVAELPATATGNWS